MKNLFLSLIALITFTIQAQVRKQDNQLTTEQRIELQVKKMTLDLDLNEKQQKDVKVLLTSKAKKMDAEKAKRAEMKEQKKTLSAEEKFELKNKMLDEKIAFKAEMKKILNEKQMQKWEENQKEREEKMQSRARKIHHKR